MSFILDFCLKYLFIISYCVSSRHCLQSTIEKSCLSNVASVHKRTATTHNMDLFTIKLKSFISDKECMKRVKEIEIERKCV